MKQELGWWFPDGETHLPDWMRKAGQYRGTRLQYQFHKYQRAVKWVRPHRRMAIDVGAHIGQWSHNMALDFQRVVAFEPVPQYAECWRRNLRQAKNAHLEPIALGREAGRVTLRCGTPGSHGDTFVDNDTPAEAAVATDVPMLTLDEFGFTGVDLIKVDCEGYELNVLRGGERTIREENPCIIVEQKPGMAQKFGFDETEAVALLESWGATKRAVLSGDFILAW